MVPRRRAQIILIVAWCLLFRLCHDIVLSAPVHIVFNYFRDGSNAFTLSPPTQDENGTLAFDVNLPNEASGYPDTEICVHIHHTNGHVDACHYVFEYMRRHIDVHGVVSETTVDVRATRDGVEIARSGAQRFNMFMYDSRGNIIRDNDTLYHPETGSLPLIHTGNLSAVFQEIPRLIVPSLLTYGKRDAIGAYRFSQVAFDAVEKTVYMMQRGENVTIDIPDNTIVTTTHRRFVQGKDEGWNESRVENEGEEPMWFVNTEIDMTPAPTSVVQHLYDAARAFELSNETISRDNEMLNESNVSAPVRYGGGHCVAVPTFVVNIPLPLFYWHTMAEGIFPLAYAIQHMQKRLNQTGISPLIVLAQGWNDRLVPRFLYKMLQGMTVWPVLDMETLRSAGPTCFIDLTIGYFPQITNPREFRVGTEWLLRQFAANLTSDLHRIEGPSVTSPFVTFVQRRNRCAASDKRWLLENHTISRNGTGQNQAARSIANLNDLEAEARSLGAIVQVLYLESMTARDQIIAFRRSDVVVAAHGSAWANTAFMRERSAAIQLFGYGLKDCCVALMNMYRHTYEAMDDLCNGLLIDFPSVVPGYYAEIIETDPTAHIPPFSFAEEFCTDDPMRGENIAIHSISRRDANASNATDGQKSCKDEADGDDEACRSCESEIEVEALKDPRWLWGHHFHRAYRWYKSARFTVRPSVFRDELRKALRVLELPHGHRHATPEHVVSRVDVVTPGFEGNGEYDPPMLKGYVGPFRHSAVSCCNLSPSWVRMRWIEINEPSTDTLSCNGDDDSRCASAALKIGEGGEGSFEPMSLSDARRVCDSDDICKGFAYGALGALFKFSVQPLVSFMEADMLKETGRAHTPATFYAKMSNETGESEFACSTLRLPRPLSLAYVHYYLPHGGVETVIHSLTQRLSPHCFDITVVIITDWMMPDGGPMRSAIEQAGARVEIWPLLTTRPEGDREPGHAGISYPVDLSVLHSLLPRLSAFDVIHSFYGGAYLSSVGMDAVSLTRLLTPHGSGVPPVHVNSIAAVIPLLSGHEHVDAVIMDSVPSFELAQRSRERFDTHNESVRVELIEAGIDTKRFDPDAVDPWLADANTTRAENEDIDVVVGFVGRIAHQKQPKLFVRVASYLASYRDLRCNAETTSMPRFRFVMVGSGQLNEEVSDLCDELNVDVEMYQSTPHVPEVLASLDIFLHLSVWDTAAYGVREAMAMKLPIVALRSNMGVAAYVEDGVDGYLVDDHEVESIASAIVSLACNESLRQDMGRSGRDKIVSSSTKHQFWAKHAHLYADLWRARGKIVE